jgi:hypothetical protein
LEHNISVRKFWGIFICFACGLWKSEAKRSSTGGSDSFFCVLKRSSYAPFTAGGSHWGFESIQFGPIFRQASTTAWIPYNRPFFAAALSICSISLLGDRGHLCCGLHVCVLTWLSWLVSHSSASLARPTIVLFSGTFCLCYNDKLDKQVAMVCFGILLLGAMEKVWRLMFLTNSESLMSTVF